MGVLSEYKCTQYSQRPEVGIRSPGTGITEDYELPCGCWNPNLDPLQEQQRILTTEPSTQILFF